jgi:hypothetical protein
LQGDAFSLSRVAPYHRVARASDPRATIDAARQEGHMIVTGRALRANPQ